MTKSEALDALKSDSPDTRLRAAIEFEKLASADDLPAIRLLLAEERDSWVVVSLTRIIDNLQNPGQKTVSQDLDPEIRTVENAEDVIREGNRKFAEMLLHEIEPIVGQVEVSASRDIPSYGDSTTSEKVQYLKQSLQFIGEIQKGFTPAVYAEINLTDMIADVVESIETGAVQVEYVADPPIVVMGDINLVRTAFQNMLSNAIEAFEEDQLNPLVTISAGYSGLEASISIKDNGRGMPESADAIWNWGVSTKSKSERHFGHGLPLARQCIEYSHGGSVSLKPNASRGAIAEIKWPQMQS